LNLLHTSVDYFIIVESTHTHVGNEKPLHFEEVKHLFEKINDKIIHIIVDDFPHKAPYISLSPLMNNGEQWVNERYQRNCIARGFEQIPDLQEEDLIIISDMDEIPDPRTLVSIKNGNISVTINKLEMDLYYYNLNTKFTCKWHLGYITRFDMLVNSKRSMSDLRQCKLDILENGGWHLSYFGDVNFIQNKLQQFGHIEYSGEEYTNETHITQKIQNGI